MATQVYDEKEALTPFGREVDEIAYKHIRGAIEELCVKGVTVKQAILLLYENVGFVGSETILNNRSPLMRPPDP
jgi:hypothetical protein